MLPTTASMTRVASTDSSSALSNIVVGSGQAEAGAMVDDSGSEQPTASTPPTSVSDNRSIQSSKGLEDVTQPTEEHGARRPKRSRTSVGSYNLKKLADAQLPVQVSPSRNPSGLSGRTLVDGNAHEDEDEQPSGRTIKQRKLGKDAQAQSSEVELPPRPARKPSVTERIKNGVKNATGSVRSILGKRRRDVVESGRRKLGLQKEVASPQKNKLLKELDMGRGGVLDELDLDNDDASGPSRPAKRAKTSGKAVLQEIAQPLTTGPLQKTSDGKQVKKWQTEGLYVGQDFNMDPALVGPNKLQKKRAAAPTTGEDNNAAPIKRRRLNFGLPMFKYLDKTRDFTIPYDVFAPSLRKGHEKPKDWHKVNRNRLVGEAKDIWDRSEKLAPSLCVCDPPSIGELGCDYDCLNRVMQYECNKDNCGLDGAVCSNRPFAELSERTKKGGSFDIGVEVLKTDQRGFGIRSCRSFRPGQIIMEYTGEIITEGECQRRMREEYKDKACYYLMELERNLVIDGTKGSMARFINHSCEPNCEVRMLKVNGTPRMAVFAGDSGIMTGEELTYDYNFDNFGETRQPCYCGAPTCRGYLGKRLNAVELKKLLKEDAEQKRKAAEIAEKAAQDENRKKKIKTERGAGWVGWVPVEEVKAQLKEQKRLKEEQEKNSTRAQRLAARGSSISGGSARSPAVLTKSKNAESSTRRRTVHVPLKDSTKAEKSKACGSDSTETKTTKQTRRTSAGSRFTESLDSNQRPSSRNSARASPRRPTQSVKSSVEVQYEEDEEIAVSAPSLKRHSESAIPDTLPGASNDEPILEAEPAWTEQTADWDAKTGARNSIISSVSAAVKSATGLKTGESKWVQSRLSFTKKS